MLDLRWNVLVVWIGPGKLRNMGMFKWVIPSNFFAGLIDFVALAADATGFKVNEFPNVQGHVAGERHLALELSQGGTDGRQHSCRALNAWIPFLECIDQFSVGAEIWYGH